MQYIKIAFLRHWIIFSVALAAGIYFVVKSKDVGLPVLAFVGTIMIVLVTASILCDALDQHLTIQLNKRNSEKKETETLLAVALQIIKNEKRIEMCQLYRQLKAWGFYYTQEEVESLMQLLTNGKHVSLALRYEDNTVVREYYAYSS